MTPDPKNSTAASTPVPAGTIKCARCGTRMVREVHADLQIDRCPECGGLWFDVTELERTLADSQGVRTTESSIPERGLSALSCPRCWPKMLESVGWSGLVFFRCPSCNGLYLDAWEVAELRKTGTPATPDEFALWLFSHCRDLGWELVEGSALLTSLVQLLWR